MEAERLAVAAHQVDLLVGADPAQRRTALGEQHQARVAGQVAGRGEVEGAVVVELVEVGGARPRARPCRSSPGRSRTCVSPRYSCASRPTAEALIRSGRSLLTRVTSKPSLARLWATARIRVSLSPSRKPEGSDSASVWLSSTRMRAAVLADRHRLVEPAVLDAQLVQHAQGRAGEVAQLGVVALALQLGDHHDGEHHLVLLEALQRPGVGQQHAGVEHVGPDGLRAGCVSRGWDELGCVGTDSPLADRHVHSSPRSSIHLRGPGECPEAGVPASANDHQHAAGRPAVVRSRPGLPMRRASPLAVDRESTPRQGGRSGETRPTAG